MEDPPVSEMETAHAWDAIKRCGAYKRGHFVRASDSRHFEDYFQIPIALQYANIGRLICSVLTRALRTSGCLDRLSSHGSGITVLAPVDAGVPVAFWVGELMGAGRIIWANRDEDGGWKLRSFIELAKGEQVLVVDDILHTGKTISSVVAQVKKMGAEVFAIGVIVDRRDNAPVDFEGIPVYSVLRVPTTNYAPRDCPLCKKGDKPVPL
jgi:orotate phosphoribosyltransferase